MKNVIVLKHQNKMRYSREFFLMDVPKELSLCIYIIVSICLSGVLIVVFGRIDDVIKTKGYVRTKANVSSVHNIIAGPIVELNYLPGEKVEKDEVLYRIDSTNYDTQRNQLLSEQSDFEKKTNGLTSLQQSFVLGKNVCDIEDELSYSRFEAYLQNKKVLELKASIAKQDFYFERDKPETIRNSFETERKEQAYRLALADLDSYKTNFIANINSEKNEVLLQSYNTQQNLNRLDNQYSFLEIKSPVEGFVQEVSSLNVGDYLEANTRILNIVPNDSKSFRVEIQIASKDIGKIKVGQKVKYRLSAFPFFEYSGAEGYITSIDPDIRTASDNRSTFYSAYADIDRIEFSNRHGDTFPIRAGLETDVRIVMERKTILYFLLKKLDFIN